MAYIETDKIEERELVPGFHARLIHTDGLTVAHFRIEKGSALPEHSHHHEQITNVLEGTLEMTVDGETRECVAGDVIVIPGHVVHSGRALTDCRLIDVFRPAREDYK